MCNKMRRWLGIRPWTRHGLVLVVAGFVYIGIGLSYILAMTHPGHDLETQFATIWMPMRYWGVIWIFVGFMVVVSARWPPVYKSWGYAAMSGLASAWSAFYIVGILFLDSPFYQSSSALVWGLLAFMWWAISGLVAPDEAA